MEGLEKPKDSFFIIVIKIKNNENQGENIEERRINEANEI